MSATGKRVLCMPASSQTRPERGVLIPYELKMRESTVKVHVRRLMRN